MIGTARVAINGPPAMAEAGPRRPPSLGDASGVPSNADAEATIDLVSRARGGDQAALDELCARYLPRVRRWAHGRLPPAARGAHETQDLVQDTLVKVFLRLHAFEPRHPGAFRDYVWTTLWNCIRDLARKYQRRGRPSDVLDSNLPDRLPSPFEEAMGGEVLERYERALERLRPEDREAIVARIELGLSHADVAAALGKPSVAAAHMAVSRALMRLAEEMAHERKRTP
jgi:RNA polymerase sigma factor (sigma-70 family)